MLERRDTYDALYNDFRWILPERFNIGAAVSSTAGPRLIPTGGLFDYHVDGAPDRLTFAPLALNW